MLRHVSCRGETHAKGTTLQYRRLLYHSIFPPFGCTNLKLAHSLTASLTELSQTLPQPARMATFTCDKNGNGSGTAAAEGGSGNRNYCIIDFVDQGSVESSRYFYARRTVCEMLRDRGYDVPGSELTRSLDDFRRVFGQQPNVDSLRICVSLRSNPSSKVLVIFLGTADVKVETIRLLYGKIMNQERLSRLILVLQSKMTTYAGKELQKWPFRVEIFKIHDLLVNISKHTLQPKYEVLTTDEKEKLLEKYKMEAKQLPCLLETDGMARYYGLEKGQVVRISHTVGRLESFETYRCVV
ncbi:DNA-directed RNA polymerase V subunit 5C-like [Neltuma alba]|uniref:DNA-directed RNA polymerase V subunit 5C-like n=1 Tax=Neltuma alba TaxID=207710 RepID=UPI0010A59631|nr:DNA-directed RNA polymerase V subunit 5C-like [Prosopis alba]